MKIKVNGEFRESESATISQLLKELDIIPERVAVEVNLRVIKRVDFDNYKLHDGDTVEIVNFVGGGTYYRCLGHGNWITAPFF
jgi:thiamine biosynthesis protein ThiS